MANAHSGGGWKSLFWFAVGAAGLGFAGYVYLVPYQKMQRLAGARQSETAVASAAAESAAAERDALKEELAKLTSAAEEKQGVEGKRRARVEALAAALKPGLEELGATIVTEATAVEVSFAAAKLIDKNGIDVSDEGQAAIKILAGVAKKEGGAIRVRARSSAGAPPKELRTLFHSAGEMNAVRAARVMSAIEGAGLPPGRVGTVGQAAAPVPRLPRGRKPPPAPPERVELEVQPE